MLYRFVIDGTGIYAQVDEDCPRDDPRREGKPDGSWLAKVGERYPGAVSFWTEEGLKKYVESGLCAWHLSVTSGNASVKLATMDDAVYKDEFQVICDPEEVTVERTTDADDFLSTYTSSSDLRSSASHPSV